MPRAKWRRRALATMTVAALALVALPAVAGAACQPGELSTPFAQFGDNASYTPAPGGSFDTNGAGWSLRGAEVAAGSWSDGATTGSHYLAIAPGGSAASPWVCVSSEYPTFRFFERQASGTAPLNASLRWVDLLGLTVETSVGSVQSGGVWSPSPVLNFGDEVPIWLPGSSAAVALVFSSPHSAAWDVDDVYIDPYSR